MAIGRIALCSVKGIITIREIEVEVTGNGYIDLTDAVANKLLELKAYGGCTQASTPTPSTPVDIVCNNGALKVKDKELPVGYVRLASIEFAGSTYYDTNQKLYGTDTISMKISGNQATGMNCFGAYTGTSSGNYNYSLYVYFHNSNNCYLRYGDNLYRPNLGTGTKTITFGPGATTGFSSNVTITADTFESTDAAYIGALPNSSSAKFNGTFYGNIEVTDTNGTRLKWIPCKRKSDGVIGYYEVVNGNFLEPVGDTPTAGAEDYSNIEVYVEGTTETIGVHSENAKNMYGGDYYSILVTSSIGCKPIKISGDSWVADGTRRGIAKIIAVEPNTTYTFSYSAIQGVNYVLTTEYASIEDMDDYSSAITSYANTTFTTSATTNYLLIGARGYPTPTAGTIVSITNPQLEAGNQATTYEPYYDGGTATCEDLLGVGDYKDEQEILSGDVITKVGVAVLTGDENWLKSPAWGKVNTNVFYYSVPDGKIWTIGTAPLGETLTVYTHFKSVSRNYIYDADEVCAGWSGGSSAFSLTVRVSNTIDTAADFKQWLASQLAAGTPVIVVYPLATPTTLSVAGQSLSIPAGDSRIEIVEGSILNLPLYAKYKANE